MKRTLVLLAVVALVAAPAATAKDPHAILSSGSDPVEAGTPWEVRLELMETKGASRPTLMARRGDRLIAVRGRLEVVDRRRRFEFPAVGVGSGRAPQDYVSFPNGRRAVDVPEQSVGLGEQLPPETVRPADEEPEDEGGFAVWILPLAGLALAGAGAGVWRLRALAA
jgi:hypothetical protein